jgi:hypothetical protein
MNDTIRTVVNLVQQDKRTTWAAALVVSLGTAGEGLEQFGGADPQWVLAAWGLKGLAALVAVAALLVAKFSKPEPQVSLTPLPAPGESTSTEKPS